MGVNGAGKYPKEYLEQINEILKNRIDGNVSGKKDGKVTVNEAYKDLQVGSLFADLKEGSQEYNRLKALTDKIPEALSKYAGKDGVFQAKEWADFLNGKEWGQVLDAYHSSSNFAQLEMKWIDNSKGAYNDGNITKGEVKVGLFNSLEKTQLPANCDKEAIRNKLEDIVEKYVGDDGVFTLEEYTKMKNDPEYKQLLKEYHLYPFDFS
jgi:hypothetical protein